MPHEIVYQYNGKPNLRDEPEFDANDTTPIPVRDQIVRRKDANYRVTSVSTINSPGRRVAGLATYLVDLMPLDEFPSDSSD
jgi:hypothetical protein